MKVLKKTFSLTLVLIFIIGIVPMASFNGGKGVFAATGQEVVQDALSFAVENDYENPKTPKLNYVWGGLDLTVGCDCSGFVCAIFKRHGLDLVALGIRSSYDMQANPTKFGTVVNGTDPSLIQNGDILITNSGGHAGIGWNNNGTPYMIHCQNHKMGCVYQPFSTYNSAIVMIIRPYVISGKGGNVNPPSGGGTTPAVPGESENPGYPYAIPTSITSGDSVKWLQTALNKVMNSGLIVDGAAGTLTKNAISAFQKKVGLPDTGTADKATIDKLVEVHKAANAVTKITVKASKDTAIYEGDSVQLMASLEPEAAKNAAVTWTSTNGGVLSVTSSGMVTAVGGGNASVVAKTANGKSATVSFSVTGKKRSNEWLAGQWYGADGNTDYKSKGHWMQSKGGWWFTDDSGWYPANCWQKIDKKWYYFDSNGYVLGKGWRQVDGVYYYFNSSGQMAENEWVGGYWLSAGGSWSYTAVGQWRQNATGWWYEDTAGWYPKNDVVQIDNTKYYFNSDGYWITN